MEYMTDIKVIDNVLDEDYFFQLQSHMLSNNWPWYFNSNITNGESVDNSTNYGFFNCIIKQREERTIGPFGTSVIPRPYNVDTDVNIDLLNAFISTVSSHVGSKQIIRMRMDMTVNRGQSYLNEPHVDLTYPHTTTIFYVNDVDGNTLIYDQMNGDDSELTIKQEIQPKANRLIVFDGLHLHTGHTPTTCNQRVLINSNWA
tara:strand:+ start:15 stop:617 length:603 start_codon:yes stop_codon:yes gene_type:complete